MMVLEMCLTLVSKSTDLVLYKKSKIKKIDPCILEKKNRELSLQNIIFEGFVTDRGTSQLLMTDSFL